MNKFNVVCHVADCENSEQIITIETSDDDPIVICGPCGVQITDIWYDSPQKEEA